MNMSQATTSTFNGSNQRYCARCRNHDLQTPLRNHRGKCWFRSCVCPACSSLDNSYKWQRMYNQRRRARQQLTDDHDQISEQGEVTDDSQEDSDGGKN